MSEDIKLGRTPYPTVVIVCLSDTVYIYVNEKTFKQSKHCTLPLVAEQFLSHRADYSTNKLFSAK